MLAPISQALQIFSVGRRQCLPGSWTEKIMLNSSFDCFMSSYLAVDVPQDIFVIGWAQANGVPNSSRSTDETLPPRRHNSLLSGSLPKTDSWRWRRPLWRRLITPTPCCRGHPSFHNFFELIYHPVKPCLNILRHAPAMPSLSGKQVHLANKSAGRGAICFRQIVNIAPASCSSGYGRDAALQRQRLTARRRSLTSGPVVPRRPPAGQIEKPIA